MKHQDAQTLAHRMAQAVPLEEVVRLAQTLVRMDSVAAPGRPHEQNIARFLADRLEKAGLAVHVTEVAPLRLNVIAEWTGKGSGRTLLLEGHTDVVFEGPPADLVTTHAGREAVEVYGPPARLMEVERDALAVGVRTRRTGTSIALLGIDSANGTLPQGERRPANLEDVFVLLTGEEIA